MAKRGRPRAEVVLTDEERRMLVRLTKRSRVNRALAFRGRIVVGWAWGWYRLVLGLFLTT